MAFFGLTSTPKPRGNRQVRHRRYGIRKHYHVLAHWISPRNIGSRINRWNGRWHTMMGIVDRHGDRFTTAKWSTNQALHAIRRSAGNMIHSFSAATARSPRLSRPIHAQLLATQVAHPADKFYRTTSGRVRFNFNLTVML